MNNPQQRDKTTVDYWTARWENVGTASPNVLQRFRSIVQPDADMDKIIARFVDASGEFRPTVLELGCAPGNLLVRIHRVRGMCRLSGIDYSELGVKLTEDRLRERGIEATVYKGDFRTVQLTTSFDAVVSFGLLEHFEDPVAIVRAHAAFTRDGGVVGITVPNYASWPVRLALRSFSPETLDTHNLCIMSESAIRRAFLNAGLTDVRVGTAAGPLLPNSFVRHGTVAEYYRTFARGWNVMTTILPGTHRLWRGLIWGLGRT